QAAGLRNLAQLRRALCLQEWERERNQDAQEEANQRIFEPLLGRFLKEARTTVKTGAPHRRRAALVMLAEPVTNVRSTHYRKGIGRPITPDLIEVIRQETNP